MHLNASSIRFQVDLLGDGGVGSWSGAWGCLFVGCFGVWFEVSLYLVLHNMNSLQSRLQTHEKPP